MAAMATGRAAGERGWMGMTALVRMTTLLPLLSLMIVPARAAPAAPDITGVPHITSGDAFTIGKTRLRLAGLSAPALEQLCADASGARWTCGVAARDALIAHVDKKPWSCHPLRTDRYGRQVARCSVEGEDISKWVVASGWAVAFTANIKDYEADEAAARKAKAGLWAGAFIAPPDWRRRNAKAAPLGSLDVSAATRAMLLHGRSDKPPSPDCAIKGHINGSGTCIFHTPGGRWYARVSMNPANGDRWFCSKEEAELADCRETRR
jgi:endonuclease YncB( thermonuclease family)